MTQPTKVAICVATKERPKSLKRLLKSLAQLELEGLAVNLIIADNHPSGSSENVVREIAKELPFPVKYVIEPERGIPAIRNRLFAEAYALEVEFIASIDDDEVADSQWLKRLVDTASLYNADAVGGKNILQFDNDTPIYVRNVYIQDSRPTGVPTTRVGTGNALYRTAAVKSIDGPFDLRVGLSSGSDGLLSEILVSKGFHVVGCDEALTYELLPITRTNPRQVIKRGYARGFVEGRIVLFVEPSFRSITKHIVLSLGKALVGSLQVLWSLVMNREMVLRYASRASAGVGGIAFILTPRLAHQQYTTILGE